MIQFNDIDLKTFLNEFWQKKPVVLRGALPDFETPVSAEELAGLSLEDEVESRIVIQKSETDYELKKGPFTEETYHELTDENWTLLIQGMDRLVPEVTDVLNDFDFLPRWRIDDIMISYATKGGNVGPHFDHYDVFLLQAAGKRQWTLTSQDCSADNYIPGVDLRLMETFKVVEEYVFDNGDSISGGNFHVPPLALARDFAASALAELASISERRTYLLLEGHDGLPKLLMKDTGVNSGFMMPQYTAAALVSENKILCHPASVDSIPTSLGQEDHVSMGSISAFKLLSVLRNVEHVLAVELLTSAQALDFRSSLAPGRGVALSHQALRKEITHADKDYEVRNDLDRCAEILRSGALLQAVENELGPLS